MVLVVMREMGMRLFSDLARFRLDWSDYDEDEFALGLILSGSRLDCFSAYTRVVFLATGALLGIWGPC